MQHCTRRIDNMNSSYFQLVLQRFFPKVVLIALRRVPGRYVIRGLPGQELTRAIAPVAPTMLAL